MLSLCFSEFLSTLPCVFARIDWTKSSSRFVHVDAALLDDVMLREMLLHQVVAHGGIP
jgi:hypothetical protein